MHGGICPQFTISLQLKFQKFRMHSLGEFFPCLTESPEHSLVAPSFALTSLHILYSGFSSCNSCGYCASLFCQHLSSESGVPHAN